MKHARENGNRNKTNRHGSRREANGNRGRPTGAPPRILRQPTRGWRMMSVADHDADRPGGRNPSDRTDR